MILDAITPKQPRLLVADLDGTLLHDAEVFEDRFITQRSIDTINRAHDAGMQFAIATARPVSTGLQFAEKLPVDAVIYLNGALIDFDPAHSDFDLLTSGATPADENHLIKIGFSSRRFRNFWKKANPFSESRFVYPSIFSIFGPSTIKMVGSSASCSTV